MKRLPGCYFDNRECATAVTVLRLALKRLTGDTSLDAILRTHIAALILKLESARPEAPDADRPDQ